MPRAQVANLVTVLSRDLSGQPATASPRPGAPVIMDAPATVLGVRSGDEMKTVTVPAMEESASSKPYSADLYAARDRLAVLLKRVKAQGSPYTADRVRLVAESVSSARGGVRPWPDDVPPPKRSREPGAVTEDLAGVAARKVVRFIPRATAQRDEWPVFRSSAGRLLRVSWRYLLPGE
jgi:hypothetical protein